MSRPSTSQRLGEHAFPIATTLLILSQWVVWLVVRRYLLAGAGWADFALFPGAPSELGLIVSPFIHLEPAHLGVNLLVLWIFGSRLERALDSLHFIFLYLGSAWFGSLMQWATALSFHSPLALGSESGAVGSSGAVAGILGASLVRFPQSRLPLPLLQRLTLAASALVTLWVLYTATRAFLTTLQGTPEGIGHWAHLAGFVFGLGTAQLAGLQQVARQEYLARRGSEAIAKHDLAAAAVAWSALLSMRPDDHFTRRALVAVRLDLGDTGSARKLAREGLTALVKAKDQAAALGAYRGYLELIPDLDLPSGIRFRIACWLMEAGEHELAFQAFWESVREDGASAGAGALYRAGLLAWERLCNPAQAKAAWERVVEQFPDSPWCDTARDSLRRLQSSHG